MRNLIPLQRSLLAFTVASSLFGFSTALVGVFIPLIILRTGAPLAAVAEFYLIYALIKLIFNYPSFRLIQRFGAHTGLAVGFIAGAIQLLCVLLYSTSPSFSLLAVAAAS